MDGAIELVRWDVLHLLKKTKESCFVRAAQKDFLQVAIHSNAIIYLSLPETCTLRTPA